MEKRIVKPEVQVTEDGLKFTGHPRGGEEVRAELAERYERQLAEKKLGEILSDPVLARVEREEPIDLPPSAREGLRKMWAKKKELEERLRQVQVALGTLNATLQAYTDGAARTLGVPDDWIFEHQEMRFVPPKPETGELDRKE